MCYKYRRHNCYTQVRIGQKEQKPTYFTKACYFFWLWQTLNRWSHHHAARHVLSMSFTIWDIRASEGLRALACKANHPGTSWRKLLCYICSWFSCFKFPCFLLGTTARMPADFLAWTTRMASNWLRSQAVVLLCCVAPCESCQAAHDLVLGNCINLSKGALIWQDLRHVLLLSFTRTYSR